MAVPAAMPRQAPAPVAAAHATAARKPVSPLNLDYWKSYGTTVVDLAKAPFTADRGTLLTAGVVVGAIAGVSVLDNNIKSYAQRHRNDTSDRVADVGRPLGEPIVLGSLLAFGYAAGTVYGSRRLQETSLLAAESLIITAGLTEGLKRVTSRKRPNQTDDQYAFQGPGGTGKSLPSGHASHAFAVASVLAEQYDETRIVPLLSYLGASLTALSRVNDNKHWMSDVLTSAALGYVVGKLTVKNSAFRETTGLSVLPYSTGDEVGLNLAVKF